MKRTSSARAHFGAASPCRKRRRQGRRRAKWVRPFRRGQNILDSVVNLLHEAMAAASVSESRLQRLPVRTARNLTAAIRRLTRAGHRILQARQELAAAATAALVHRPVVDDDVLENIVLAGKRMGAASEYLQYVLGEVLLRQTEVLAGLACGELVPERPGDHRPRIVLEPRLVVCIRAFLRGGRPRIAERIAPVLRRRRRTPRPAGIRVPRPSVLGRAPPFPTVPAL